MIETQTTIKHGLPVIARGVVVGPDPAVGYFHYGIEDLELLWLNRRPCRLEITADEESRITKELLREGRDKHGYGKNF